MNSKKNSPNKTPARKNSPAIKLNNKTQVSPNKTKESHFKEKHIEKKLPENPDKEQVAIPYYSKKVQNTIKAKSMNVVNFIALKNSNFSENDQKSTTKNNNQNIAETKVHKNHDFDNIICNFNKYLNEAVLVLKKLSGDRTHRDKQALMKYTIPLAFFTNQNKKEKFDVNEIDLKYAKNNPSTHYKCCRVMQYGGYIKGEIIIKFGDVPDKFYIMMYGKAVVFIPQSEKFTKSTAITLNELLKHPEGGEKPYTNMSYQEMKENIEKIKYGDADLIQNWEKISDGKILYKEAFIKKSLNGLNPEDLEEKDHFFNIHNGCLEFFYIASIIEGKVFGELGLLSNKPRNATVVAVNNVITASIDKYDYHRILHTLEMNRVRAKLDFLEKRVFKMDLLTDFRFGIPFMFKKVRLNRHSYVFKQGDFSQDSYIIKSGEIILMKKVKRPKRYVKKNNTVSNNNLVELLTEEWVYENVQFARLGHCEIFGEEGIQSKEEKPRREFSAICLTDVKLSKIDQEAGKIMKYKIRGFEKMLIGRQKERNEQRKKIFDNNFNVLVNCPKVVIDKAKSQEKQVKTTNNSNDNIFLAKKPEIRNQSLPKSSFYHNPKSSINFTKGNFEIEQTKKVVTFDNPNGLNLMSTKNNPNKSTLNFNTPNLDFKGKSNLDKNQSPIFLENYVTENLFTGNKESKVFEDICDLKIRETFRKCKGVVDPAMLNTTDDLRKEMDFEKPYSTDQHFWYGRFKQNYQKDFTSKVLNEFNLQMFQEQEDQFICKQRQNQTIKRAKCNKILSVNDLKNQIKYDDKNILIEKNKYLKQENYKEEDIKHEAKTGLEAIDFLTKRAELDHSIIIENDMTINNKANNLNFKHNNDKYMPKNINNRLESQIIALKYSQQERQKYLLYNKSMQKETLLLDSKETTEVKIYNPIEKNNENIKIMGGTFSNLDATNKLKKSQHQKYATGDGFIKKLSKSLTYVNPRSKTTTRNRPKSFDEIKLVSIRKNLIESKVLFNHKTCDFKNENQELENLSFEINKKKVNQNYTNDLQTSNYQYQIIHEPTIFEKDYVKSDGVTNFIDQHVDSSTKIDNNQNDSSLRKTNDDPYNSFVLSENLYNKLDKIQMSQPELDHDNSDITNIKCVEPYMNISSQEKRKNRFNPHQKIAAMNETPNFVQDQASKVESYKNKIGRIASMNPDFDNSMSKSKEPGSKDAGSIELSKINFDNVNYIQMDNNNPPAKFKSFWVQNALKKQTKGDFTDKLAKKSKVIKDRNIFNGRSFEVYEKMEKLKPTFLPRMRGSVDFTIRRNNNTRLLKSEKSSVEKNEPKKNQTVWNSITNNSKIKAKVIGNQIKLERSFVNKNRELKHSFDQIIQSDRKHYRPNLQQSEMDLKLILSHGEFQRKIKPNNIKNVSTIKKVIKSLKDSSYNEIHTPIEVTRFANKSEVFQYDNVPWTCRDLSKGIINNDTNFSALTDRSSASRNYRPTAKKLQIPANKMAMMKNISIENKKGNMRALEKFKQLDE